MDYGLLCLVLWRNAFLILILLFFFLAYEVIFLLVFEFSVLYMCVSLIRVLCDVYGDEILFVIQSQCVKAFMSKYQQGLVMAIEIWILSLIRVYL